MSRHQLLNDYFLRANAYHPDWVMESARRDSAIRLSTWLATTLATVGAISIALASEARATQTDGLRAVDGEWIFVEDRTEGRALEQLGPPMASKFSMRVDEGVVVLGRHTAAFRVQP